MQLSGRSASGAPHFWTDGSTTNPPIKKFSPTIIFDAAFEGGQNVGPALDQRRLSPRLKNGTRPLSEFTDQKSYVNNE